MANYTNAYLVPTDMNVRCTPLKGPYSSTKAPLRCSEMPRVLIPLSLLQNYHRAAKLELFLNPDPRRAVGELMDLWRGYHVYYPLEHESLMV